MKSTAAVLCLPLLIAVFQICIRYTLAEGSKHDPLQFDIGIDGQCRSEIAYHCSFFLTEAQRGALLGMNSLAQTASAETIVAHLQTGPSSASRKGSTDGAGKTGDVPAVPVKSDKPLLFGGQGTAQLFSNLVDKLEKKEASGGQQGNMVSDHNLKVSQVKGANMSASAITRSVQQRIRNRTATSASASTAAVRPANHSASSAQAPRNATAANFVQRPRGFIDPSDSMQRQGMGSRKASNSTTAQPSVRSNATVTASSAAGVAGSAAAALDIGPGGEGEVEDGAEVGKKGSTKQQGDSDLDTEDASQTRSKDLDPYADEDEGGMEAAEDEYLSELMDGEYGAEDEEDVDAGEVEGGWQLEGSGMEEVQGGSKSAAGRDADADDDDAFGGQEVVVGPGDDVDDPADADDQGGGGGQAGSASGSEEDEIGDVEYGEEELSGSADTAADVQAGAAAARRLQQQQQQKGAAQGSLPSVLSALGMNPTLPRTVLAAATAPIARCLRHAMHEAEVSIYPEPAQVSELCREEVLKLYILRAADIRLDPPLLAACAKELATGGPCANATDAAQTALQSQSKAPGNGASAPAALSLPLQCLKASKPTLSAVCRAAVVSRQIESGEDVRLDPSLHAACKEDMEKHCADAEWDEGAMRACLEKRIQLPYPPSFDVSALLPVSVDSSGAADSAMVWLGGKFLRGGDADEENMDEDGNLVRGSGTGSSGGTATSGKATSSKAASSTGISSTATSSTATSSKATSSTGISSKVDGTRFGRQSSDEANMDEDGNIIGRNGNGAGAVARRLAYRSLLAPNAAGGAVATLLPSCAAALFKRHAEESEDIRFNYRLAVSCALDKRLFCRDVKPGRGDVVRCLEGHMNDNGFTTVCHSELQRWAILRSNDPRLDPRFMRDCVADATAMCPAAQVQALVDPYAPPGAGLPALECIRRSLPRLRNEACRRHMMRTTAAMFADSRLDAALLVACKADLGRVPACRIDVSGSLTCLQGQLAKHQELTPRCKALVDERTRLAASHFDFNTDLVAHCAAERASLCAHAPGDKVMDCLADARNRPDFGASCKEALSRFMVVAVGDVRLLTSLQRDCARDIGALCAGVEPGEGRVLACLQQHRTNVSSVVCRRQILRLLGFVVEDTRMDTVLLQACKSDIQQYCPGEKQDDGAVHACLRASIEHLTPACRQAEERVEQLEYEDIRLNPAIMKECPSAIYVHCNSAVHHTSSAILMCLRQSSTKPHFPSGCKAVLSKQMERSNLKYSLNAQLVEACKTDVSSLCAGAVDEPQRPDERSILSCLASNTSALAAPCKAELLALVRMQLIRYRMGMPLTSACDGDVMARCHVDKMTAPYLEAGGVQSCLIRHVSGLHKPCWELMSMFDDSQQQHAAALETQLSRSGAWTAEQHREAVQKVATAVQSELEAKLIGRVHRTVDAKVEAHAQSLSPRINALAEATVMLAVLVMAVTGVAVYLFRRVSAARLPERSRTVIVKDGRV